MWGCDGEADLRPGQAGVFKLECWRCSGEGCDHCQGRGEVWFQRCPTALLADKPWVHRWVRALREYEEGFLPGAGGMNDQTVPFQRVIAIMRKAAVAHRNTLARREAARREAEAARRAVRRR